MVSAKYTATILRSLILTWIIKEKGKTDKMKKRILVNSMVISLFLAVSLALGGCLKTGTKEETGQTVDKAADATAATRDPSVAYLSDESGEETTEEIEASTEEEEASTAVKNSESKKSKEEDSQGSSTMHVEEFEIELKESEEVHID